MDGTVEIYLRSLQARRLHPRHIQNVKRHLQVLAPGGVVDHALCVSGMITGWPSSSTVAAALYSLKAYIRWHNATQRSSIGAGVLPIKPPRSMPLRRVPTEAEYERIMLAAECASHSARPALCGIKRAALYALAASTGLRVGELRGLCMGDFTSVPYPSVGVSRSIAKNGRSAILRIPHAAYRRVRAAFTNRHPCGNLGLPADVNRSLQVDLAAAGVPFETSQGRFTFHAWRRLFTDRLIRGGCDPRSIQDALRHSTARLTWEVYAQGSQAGVLDALERAVS